MEGLGRHLLFAAGPGWPDPGALHPAIGDRITELSAGRRSRRAALITVCAVLFLTFLDTTIVSVTLGSVQSDLHAGVTSLQWVVNAYSLVFASLMLAAGTLGDRIGRKRVLVAGIGIFCIGSLVSVLAPTTAALIAGRAIMGVGAAASEPGTLSVIRQLYPDRQARARAIGAWAAVAGLALALGPVIGGLLVDAGSWRAVFIFNLALGALLLLASVWSLPESSDPRPERIDLAGIVFGAAFLASGAFAVIGGETAGYASPMIIGLFALSAASLVALLVTEGRTPAPMLDLHELTARVNAALFVGFAVYFGIFSIFFFTALYLDEALGYSGAHVAGVFAPMAATIAVASIGGGRWVAHGGSRAAMTLGCVLAASGLVLTGLYVDNYPDVAYFPLAGALALAGAGFGLGLVPATATVLGALPAQRSGIAASTINTSRQIGAVAGVAVLGSLINAHLTGDLRDRLQVLGVPAGLQSLAIKVIKDGDVPGTTTSTGASASSGGVIGQVFHAAYAAFRSGLTECLVVAAIVVSLAAILAWVCGATPTGAPADPPVDETR